jgi:hypothetical protein
MTAASFFAGVLLSACSFVLLQRLQEGTGDCKVLSTNRRARQARSSQAASSFPDVADGFSGLVGNTPLVYLRSLSEATGCIVLVRSNVPRKPATSTFLRL